MLFVVLEGGQGGGSGGVFFALGSTAQRVFHVFLTVAGGIPRLAGFRVRVATPGQVRTNRSMGPALFWMAATQSTRKKLERGNGMSSASPWVLGFGVGG